MPQAHVGKSVDHEPRQQTDGHALSQQHCFVASIWVAGEQNQDPPVAARRLETR
jgi:hypothetical protein